MDRESVKFVTRNAVSWCVGATVSGLVAQNVAPKSKLHKAELVVGGAAMGLMLTEHVGSHTDRWVDAVYDAFARQEEPTVVFVR
jgi:hypothetical protein